jgi:hypothetical protein
MVGAMLGNNFKDGTYPTPNGHRSVFWLYRTARFLRENGLLFPNA